MNTELMLDEIRKLCLANGAAIDKIAKDCNINQKLVSEMFMKTMRVLLDEVNNK